MSDDSEKISGVIDTQSTGYKLYYAFLAATKAANIQQERYLNYVADPKLGTVTFSKPLEVQS